MAIKRKASLGAPADNPVDILKMAWGEKETAEATAPGTDDERRQQELLRRQAAEKAHLAMSSAVEVALRKQLKSGSEEKRGVQTIARWRNDPDFVTEWEAVRRTLHGECYHQNVCGTANELAAAFGKAELLIERALKARKRRSR